MTADGDGNRSGPRPDSTRSAVVDQFSDRGDHAAIWRAFDHLLDTDAFLNLGYSAWYQTHLVGSPQRRLVGEIATTLSALAGDLSGARVLDVGCGRGGPALDLARRLDAVPVGVDLVPYNVATARANAAGVPADFLLADAAHLPLADGSVAACTAIDAISYVPAPAPVFESVSRVLRPGAPFVLSDLFVAADAGPRGSEAVQRFAEAWDLPGVSTVEAYRSHADRAGLTVVDERDLTPHSVGRFRTWTRIYRWVRNHVPGVIEVLAARWNLDAAAITKQVDRAHDALPYLRHAIIATHR